MAVVPHKAKARMGTRGQAGCHCCCSVALPGGEVPQRLHFMLGGILFTAVRFHRCRAVGAQAAESQAVLTFSSGVFLIKSCAWRKCDILAFMVRFTEGDQSEGSCGSYRAPSLHLPFVSTVLEV